MASKNMMTITISTLDGVVERIEVLNQGHPETGDWPEDDDLRKYRWRTVGRGYGGHVEHHRDEGALVLSQIVLSAINGR